MTQIEIDKIKARILGGIRKGEGGCWEWIRFKNEKGYGRNTFVFDDKKEMFVHRASYRVFRGDIPSGFVIDHICRNKACANPDHMEVVSPGENSRRGNVARNLLKWACKRGHALIGDNLSVGVHKGYVRRRCKVCDAARPR